MSLRRLAEVQPDSFAFTPENDAWCDTQIAKYPEGRQASAVLSLLWRAQAQHDYWLPKPAIEDVARKLGMPYIRVLEVATFYSMFNLEPVGKHFIQMCGTTPCMLQGSDAIKAVLERKVGPMRKVRADGIFCWLEVECLGACCNAPMVQINDDYYEDLTPENFEKLLDDLEAGRPVQRGSQIGRRSSEPVGGLTSLAEFYGNDGHSGPGHNGDMPSEPHPDSPHNGPVTHERTTQATPVDQSAMAHRDLRQSENIAEPDYVETGTSRTEPAISDTQKEHEQAQAAASGGNVTGPSVKPGHEPSHGEPSHGEPSRGEPSHDEAGRGGPAAHTEKP